MCRSFVFKFNFNLLTVALVPGKLKHYKILYTFRNKFFLFICVDALSHSKYTWIIQMNSVLFCSIKRTFDIKTVMRKCFHLNIYKFTQVSTSKIDKIYFLLLIVWVHWKYKKCKRYENSYQFDFFFSGDVSSKKNEIKFVKLFTCSISVPSCYCRIVGNRDYESWHSTSPLSIWTLTSCTWNVFTFCAQGCFE